MSSFDIFRPELHFSSNERAEEGIKGATRKIRTGPLQLISAYSCKGGTRREISQLVSRGANSPWKRNGIVRMWRDGRRFGTRTLMSQKTKKCVLIDPYRLSIRVLSTFFFRYNIFF